MAPDGPGGPSYEEGDHAIMGAPDTGRPLRLLVLADQRRTLRHLSRFLGALGYEVRQVTTVDQAVALMESWAPDFLVIDSDPVAHSARDLCRLAGQQAAGRVYTFLMHERPAPDDVTRAIEAGVDDFLARPPVYAELLVRLRAGARVLELERRLREQSGTDAQTGLPNRRALEERLRDELARAQKDHKALACVLADVDLLSCVNHAYGWAAGDKVLRGVAGELAQFCGGGQTLAALGGGRFAVVLPETTAPEAAAWAERVRALVADAQTDLADGAVRATVSFGVAACPDGRESPGELIDRAAEALHAAKSSGRNCVAAAGQFDEEEAAWADLAAPGRLFERTAARDVMKPCPLVLRARQTVEQAAALLHRTGLSEAPVADAEGRLVGMLAAETVLDRPSAEASCARVAEVMSTDVPKYDEETPLADLIRSFTHGTHSTVAVTAGGRPTGTVSTAALAALSEPLTTATFAPAGRYSPASDYLLVADAEA